MKPQATDPQSAPYFWENVGFVRDETVNKYFLDAPFDPPEQFPELPVQTGLNPNNDVYRLVRSVFIEMKLDEQRIGTKEWNPLRGLVTEGDKVVVKPNLVTHKHYLGDYHLFSTIIHGSFLRPIVDYLRLALGESGTITIADNPIESADFDQLMKFTGIAEMVEILRGRGYNQLKFLDLRPRVIRETESGEFISKPQPGDPLGYVDVDLKQDSMFSEFDGRENNHYYTLADPAVDHFDPHYVGKSTTDDFHNDQTHKYIVSKTVLDADVVVNVAKMKCHCKSGVSLNLKNMIGVVYDKFCMPHHRPGMLPQGDSFPSYPARHYVFARQAYVKLRKWIRIHRFPGFRRFRNSLQKNEVLVGQHIEHGNWKGNDTIWRTVLDLNRIMAYGDVDGTMHSTPQRKFLCFVDGIISQQGDAPINGEAIATSTVVAGFNPVITSALTLKIMGIDRSLISSINRAVETDPWPLLADPTFDLGFADRDTPNLEFKLSKGWRN